MYRKYVKQSTSRPVCPAIDLDELSRFDERMSDVAEWDMESVGRSHCQLRSLYTIEKETEHLSNGRSF